MRKTQLVLALAAISFAGSALATNGYFSHGYGMKAKGMAGAATAMAQDAFGGANNPASMVWVGNRIDVGADLFSPRREMSRTGVDPTLAPAVVDGSATSEDNYFLIPEFGYNRMINPNMSLGVSVYGNGGMNTDYKDNNFICGIAGPVYNALCGVGDVGVDLMQLIIAPTLAYKVNEQHSIGISPLIGIQRFSATGLQAFTTLSSSPTDVTNKGNDYASGLGARLGWMGKVSDKVTLGAAYSSKIYMSELEKYRGLFAEQGDFDIPSNWNVGLAVQATPQVKVALDFQRINYSDIAAINNPSTNAAALGVNNGPGFGWDDVNVWKLGVEYGYSKNLVLRAGWNHGDNPIQARDVTFNILAPGVVQDHLTLGFTYTTPSGGEWTMAYMHAFTNDVTGASLLPPMFSGGLLPPSGSEQIKMHQDSLGIAYSWKL
jgi:long-chain fatty acid transport protein